MSHLRVLFCPCVVRKATAQVETKTLNMCHQAQKGFCGVFVGIPQPPMVILSYDVVFDEKIYTALSYTSQPYSEAMAMRLAVTYTPYATSSKEQTGNVITFAQFEEGDILTETRKNTEIGDKSESKSLMTNEQDMDNINENEKSDHDNISTEMLEDIRDGSKTHPNVSKRETHGKIRGCIKQRQSEWKRVLKSTRNMGKGYIIYSVLL